MDLAKLQWEAVHTDKTVELPNYTDIRRDTLQCVCLYKKKSGKREDIIKIERPDDVDKWLISFRMRSQLEDGILKRRFWIFNDRSRGEITRVHENGTIDKVKKWSDLQIKPATITNIDEL